FAFSDLGPAGSGAGEFRPDAGAVRAGELPQRFAAQPRLQGAALALVEAGKAALLVPEVLHFAPVAAHERRRLQALFRDSSPVLPCVPEGGEGIEARDAGKKGQNAFGMFRGAVAENGGAAGALHIGKRLAFGAVALGELLPLQIKTRPPDSMGLLQGVAALPRRTLFFFIIARRLL